jgi:hypothetical protein
MEPAPEGTDQVAAVDWPAVVPETVAAKVRVPPVVVVAVAGETLTVTTGTGAVTVTVAVPILVGAATLVAVITYVPAVAGAT